MKRMIIAAAVTLAATSAYSADLKLTGIVVKQNLRAGVPYDVGLKYTGDPANVSEVCFLWSGEGPYCWDDLRVDKGSKTIRTKARTGNPNTYTLTGFVRYSGGMTNRVSAKINVK